MPSHNIMKFIKQLNRPIFTTYELTANSGKSRSTTTQALNYLVRQSLITKYNLANASIHKAEVIMG